MASEESNNVCKLCDIKCQNGKQLKEHLEGSKHFKKQNENQTVSVECEPCQRKFTSTRQLLDHQNGAKHLKKCNKNPNFDSTNFDSIADANGRLKYNCKVCPHLGFIRSLINLKIHYQSGRHQKWKLLRNATQNEDEDEELKCQICPHMRSLNSEEQMEEHEFGKKHKKNVKRMEDQLVSSDNLQKQNTNKISP